MKLYLVSNNLLLDSIAYDNSSNLDLIRMARPLSIFGEKVAKEFSDKELFNSVEKIYSSFYSGALSAAKYLSNKLDIKINMSEKLNECKVGILGNKNMRMLKGLQDHEFSYKLPNGESLNDVGARINNFVKEIIDINEDAIIFTHKRAILGFLLKYAKVGYNLEDNLILEYNSKIIYDDSETNIDIYEITVENFKIKDIKVI